MITIKKLALGAMLAVSSWGVGAQEGMPELQGRLDGVELAPPQLIVNGRAVSPSSRIVITADGAERRLTVGDLVRFPKGVPIGYDYTVENGANRISRLHVLYDLDESQPMREGSK